MKVFWTSFFRIVVFFLVVFYLKTFDATLGSQVATWISPTAVVSPLVGSGTEDPVLSGLTTLQTSVDALQSQLDDIASKLGVTSVITTGTTTVEPAKTTTGAKTK